MFTAMFPDPLHVWVKHISVFHSELESSLSSSSSAVGSSSPQSLSVRAWFRCVLQQHLYKNPDGSDSRTSISTESIISQIQ